jgi:hypothetical protein
MSEMTKLSGVAPAHLRDSEDGDVLHFLSRTLQAHVLDAEPQHVLAKLQALKDALIQQEKTLSAWPSSPSKERICAALTKAKRRVTQIVADIEHADRRATADLKAS